MSAAKSSTDEQKNGGFSAEERAAMKERAGELKAEARRDAKDAKAREKGDAEVREKIAEMPGAERAIAERLHEIVTENAPELLPKLWYGMPAYARDGKVLCFFQSAQKFDTRYSTFGFNDNGVIPPASRNHLSPCCDDMPAAAAASCVVAPSRIAHQNTRRTERETGTLIITPRNQSVALTP